MTFCLLAVLKEFVKGIFDVVIVFVFSLFFALNFYPGKRPSGDRNNTSALRKLILLIAPIFDALGKFLFLPFQLI